MMKELDKIPGKNPFRVPENYFAEVNRKIFLATSETVPEKVPEKKVTVTRMLKPFLAVAASLAILVIFAWLTAKLSDRDNGPGIPDIAFLSNTELIIDELDLFTIERTVAESGIFEEITDLENDEIIDYLMTEEIDIDDIYEKL